MIKQTIYYRSEPWRASKLCSGRMVVLNRPIFHRGSPLVEALKVRWIGPHFFFSFEISYQREPLKPRLGGLPRLVTRFSQKPLAVPAFTVHNGRA